MDPLISSRLFVLGCLVISQLSIASSRSQWAHDVRRFSHTPSTFNPSTSFRGFITHSEIRPHISVSSNVRGKSFEPSPVASVHVTAYPGDVYSSRSRSKSQHYSGLFSASATVMDFNEDTRKYLPKTGIRPQKRQLIPPIQGIQSYYRPSTLYPYVITARNGELSENHKSNTRKKSEEKFPTEDISCSTCNSKVSKAPIIPPRRKIRIRIPAKVLMFANSTLEKQKKEETANIVVSHPSAGVSIHSLHSPMRIYIPVQLHEENISPGSHKRNNCVRCPTDETLEPGRGETCVPVPIPSVSVCPFLAHLPGRVNVAITSGPSPGIRVSEGTYPIELILWKKGGHMFHCQYELTIKVNRCKPLSTPKHGSIECSNGTIWGSQCHFTCLPNHILIGHHYVTCDGSPNNLSWTSETVKCRRKRASRMELIQRLPCKKPDVPLNGTILCNKNNRNGLYSDGSVCQLFCFHGYNGLVQSSPDSLTVCHNGTWSPPPNVTCVDTKCSKPPEPKHGTYKCQEVNTIMNTPENKIAESKFIIGTICKLRCEIGYVVPASQLSVTHIECIAPLWNSSLIPECKRVIPPTHHPDDCHDEILKTDIGSKVKIKLPRFTANNGVLLTPICSQPALLSPGNYTNFCEVTDLELQVTTTCSYEIQIIERLPPFPHPNDCQNKILRASRKGTAVFKPPRFLSTRQETNRTLKASCTHIGVLDIGTYINYCFAHDTYLNTTGHCTFTVTVQGVSCSKPPAISHGRYHCIPNSRPLWSYPPRAVCEYICEEGYVMPTRHLKHRIWKCLPKLQWNKSNLPTCQKAITPKPHQKDCQTQVLFLKKGSKLRLKPPRFQSSFKGAKVKVRCSLTEAQEVGNYTNFCEAKDVELRLSRTCTYDIIIKAAHCSPLEMVSNSELLCSPSNSSSGYLVGTVCQYLCHEGYVIPTSQLNHSTHYCTEYQEWNSTILPSCIPKPPTLLEPGCADQRKNESYPFSTGIILPQFMTSSNTFAEVICYPEKVEEFGTHNIMCKAYDPVFGTSSTCQFSFTVSEISDSNMLETTLSSIQDTALEPVTDTTPSILHSVTFGPLTDTITSSFQNKTYDFVSETLRKSQNETFEPVTESSTVSDISESYVLETTLSNVQNEALESVTESSMESDILESNILETTLSSVQDQALEPVTESSMVSDISESNMLETTLSNIQHEALESVTEIISTIFHSATFGLPTEASSSSSFPKETFEAVTETTLSGLQNETFVSTAKDPPSSFENDTLDNMMGTKLPSFQDTAFDPLIKEIPQSSKTETFKSVVENPSSSMENETFEDVIGIKSSSFQNTTFDPLIETSQSDFLNETYENVAKIKPSFQNETYQFMEETSPRSLQIETLEPVKGTPLSSFQNATFEPETQNLPSGIQCNSLQAPTNGYLICTAEEENDKCDVHCNPEFNFPSTYDFFKHGLVQCDQTDGLWDFQRVHNIAEIPDCLGELPMTSLRVWLKFKVSVTHCNDSQSQPLQSEIKNILLTLNADMCDQQVKCSEFQFHCVQDHQGKQLILKVTWIVEASFNPTDYEDVDLVPSVETQIEMVMENTQRAIIAEKEMSKQIALVGGQLLQGSYTQSRFLLVCQKKGFVVDPKTDKCVQCPSGTMEVNSQCVPCPEDTYQGQTGQVSCNHCPVGTHSLRGSRASLSCTG